MTGKQLNKKHLEYVNNGIYEKIYKHILELYFTIDKYEKLKIQSIDTKFVPNKLGTELVDRNVNYKSKQGLKIFVIVDKNGVILSICAAHGSEADNSILEVNIKNKIIDT